MRSGYDNETVPRLTTRPEKPEDADAIRDVLSAAFGQPDEASLVDRLRDGGHLHASSVAVLGDEVIGHAALSRGRIGSKEVLVLAPVAVAPAHQNQGVGLAVVHHVLAATTGPVVVVGDPAYYGRFGFADAADHGVEDPTFAPRPGVLQVLRAEKDVHGPIEYPPPFLDL